MVWGEGMELPPLNEGDEAINLSDLLSVRDSCLSEEELWALCRECCLVLEVVNNSPDMFQTLCITPETVAFDQMGNVCFLDLDVDPEPIYIPPEYDNVGNSYKSHLYSLGMTLLFAAEYNGEPAKTNITDDLQEILGCMTSDDLGLRPDLESVIIHCEEQLGGKLSQDICSQLVAESSFIVGGGSREGLTEVTNGLAEYIESQSTLIQQTNLTPSEVQQNGALNEYGIPQNSITPQDFHPNSPFLENSFEGSDFRFDFTNDSQDISLPQCDQSESFDNNTEETEQDMERRLRKPATNVSSSSYLVTKTTDDKVSYKPPLPKKPDRIFDKKRENSPVEPLGESKKQDGEQEINEWSKKDQEESTELICSIDGDQGGDNSDHQGTLSKQSVNTKVLTLEEIMDCADRYLAEDELWAICYATICKLKKKQKSLPAYVSSDTIVIRKNGNISFHSIPDNKPLEVIFMAPELQKGVLTAKTCLYGLAITLRAAAGKKYATVSAMSVSKVFEDILCDMLSPDADNRPSLEEAEKICCSVLDQKNIKAQNICRALFGEAIEFSMQEEEITTSKFSDQISASEDMVKPTPFKPVSGMGLSSVRPQVGTITSAFWPVPPKRNKEKPKSVSEAKLPNAFISSATHFKPIVLHRSPSPKIKSSSDGKITTTAETRELPKPIRREHHNMGDKDEVVRKLKELKQNLMKPRHSLSHDTENIDTVETRSNSSKHSESSRKSETKSKGDQTPTVSNTNNSSNALDLLLNELQKQGTVPDTHVLASSIAQYLESQLSQGSHSRQSRTSNDRTPTWSQQSSPSINPNYQYMPRDLPPNFNLNIPAQFHTQLIGQTVTLPDKHGGGGVLASHPLQLQLQQDPRTGFIQLVPVGMVAPLSNQSPAHANRSPGARNMEHYHSSPSTHSACSDREGNLSKLNDNSPKSKSNIHGRTAKDLVQKTANQRAKNMGRVVPDQEYVMSNNNGLRRSKSDHEIDQFSGDQILTDNERGDRLSSSFNGAYGLQYSSEHDDRTLNYPEPSNTYFDNGHTNHYGNNNRSDSTHGYQPQTFRNGRSENSSPSLSKDSGVSGLNGGLGYQPPVPGSLVERLLNSENLRHQKMLGRVTYLLQEEFARDGLMAGGNEDSSIAEYVVSLANLKSETFASAITEKFPDLNWGTDLLNSLFSAVNIGSAPVQKRNFDGKHGDEQWKGKHPDRLREDADLSSSSLSESNNRNPNRWSSNVENQFDNRQTRPASEKPPSNHYFVETSDSTDSDHYERKRRYKKKHHLDKNKSSSLHNLLSDESVSANSNGNDFSVENAYRHQFSGNRNTVLTNQTSHSASAQNGVVEQGGSRQIRQGESKELADKPKEPTSHSDSSNSAKNYPFHNRNDKSFKQSEDASPKPPLLKAIGISSSFEVISADKIDPAPSFVTDVSKQRLSNEQGNKNTVERKLDHSVNRDSYRAIQLIGRESSISSLSSSQSGTLDSSMNSVDSRIHSQGNDVEPKTKGHVVYHWAMIQLSMSDEVEKFMQDIDEENPFALKTKLQSVEQQMNMELKMRRKTLRFYNRMLENSKTGKGDHRLTTTTQVSKDIREMSDTLRFSALCKTHIQMLQAELQGVDTSYLYSIAICPPGGLIELKPLRENPLLQFQCVREPHTGCEVQALNAGMPEGLISYLFASTALSDGYVHQFFFCYRYFAQPLHVLEFIINRYLSSSRGNADETNLMRIQCRAMDLLHFWVEGYHSVDFEGKLDLIDVLQEFLNNKCPDNREGEKLLALLEDCKQGRHMELLCPNTPEDVKVTHQDAPRRWDSFKSLVRKRMGNPKDESSHSTTVCVEKRRRNYNTDDVYFPKVSRRTDAFTLSDYTSQSLAEQLTLIEQAIFQMTHPVHFLNSKARGVSVALTMSGTRTPSLLRMNSYNAVDDLEMGSLFIGCQMEDTAVQRLIDHAQEISHWVAAEIVSCSSSKNQLAVLTKFVYTADTCRKIRNYATCLAILEGLENLIIKQLPAWRNLPSKCVSVMEDLVSLKMHLKNDALYLMEAKDCYLIPTIPSVLLFLLHVQQLELGTFQLANAMYKWSKIRSITQVIDQIRIFKEHSYNFEANYDLQDTLQQRIQEFSAQDLHAIAVQNDMNYQRMSSGGLSGAFRKMKGKLHSK
ncbi:hypothetical protein ScPMuIL_001782 [Solemya velum]